MPTRKIDSIEHWNTAKAYLRSNGYRLWQWQHDSTHKEGFHAWFCKEGKEDIEIVTFDKKVQEAILEYNM